MLDLKQIRDNPEQVRRAALDKHVALDLDALLAADQQTLSLARSLQELQEKRNHNATVSRDAQLLEPPRLASAAR